MVRDKEKTILVIMINLLVSLKDFITIKGASSGNCKSIINVCIKDATDKLPWETPDIWPNWSSAWLVYQGCCQFP